MSMNICFVHSPTNKIKKLIYANVVDQFTFDDAEFESTVSNNTILNFPQRKSYFTNLCDKKT